MTTTTPAAHIESSEMKLTIDTPEFGNLLARYMYAESNEESAAARVKLIAFIDAKLTAASPAVPSDQPDPLNTLMQIAQFMDDNINQQQTGVDTWDFASEFDYNLGHAACTIRSVVEDLRAQLAAQEPASSNERSEMPPAAQRGEWGIKRWPRGIEIHDPDGKFLSATERDAIEEILDAHVAATQQGDEYEDCPKCKGSRLLGEVRGIRCSNCNGSVLLAATRQGEPVASSDEAAVPDADAKDAARYRWLRDKARSVDWNRNWSTSSYTTHCRTSPDQMDRAIDAAIAAAPAAPEQTEGK